MSDRKSQQDKANDFLELHKSDSLFVLPNAWDVASAMIFVHEGFSAIGTTSAGIAASLGYPDGQRMSFRENLEVAERIVRHTDLPVSVDFESGYGETLDGLKKRALTLFRAGVVGLNIEDRPSFDDDRLVDASLNQEKIGAIRQVADEIGFRFIINARTDAYLLGDTPDNSLREAIRRGNAYADAGADCVFVPDTGSLGRNDIKVLVEEIDAPINVIAGATMPCLAELEELGVSRLSLGPRPMRVALSLLRQIAAEIRSEGTFELMSKESISYDEVNAWFSD